VTEKRREIEALVLAMLAAVPLYFTYTIGMAPLLVFHAAMAGILLRVALGKSPDLLPPWLMRALAIAYVPFLFVDWRFLSFSALGASAHLLLFIVAYLPMEAEHRTRHGLRMLATALIFTASLATSTHITILPVVIVFAFLTFRQLMIMSHEESARSLDRPLAVVPTSRAASFYLAGAMGIGVAIFPMLPRVRSPFLQGFSGPLPGSSTAVSETIDFTQPRITPTDASVVARVWMEPASRPFFAPIRLRGRIYDRYNNGEWIPTFRGMRDVPPKEGFFPLGRPRGTTAAMSMQLRPRRGRIFLPVGTYAFTGLTSRLYEGAAPETYYTYQDGVLNLSVRLSTETEPATLKRVVPLVYPLRPEVTALARRIVGNETRPEQRAALIEQYLSSNFRYVPNPASLAKTMSVDDFLLRERAGHCEYFAAGMVVLLTALDVPSRIAGGYYGGRYNPLGGYYAIRGEDAHAWTEVWNGSRWVTYDSTPPNLRPGQEAGGALREYLVGMSDSLTFIWDRYVLTFSLADQISLIEDLIVATREWVASVKMPRVAVPRIGPAVALVLVVLVAFIVLTRRRRTLFDELAKHLAARGIEVGPAMTMEEALRAHPDAARELEPLVQLYEEEMFSARPDRNRVRMIRRKLAAMKVTA
jgi:protein-glutamine gamma-glutamyltransferase